MKHKQNRHSVPYALAERREVKNVKKAAFVILALALLMTLVAVPVIAEPIKGQKVEAKTWQTGFPVLLPPLPEWWIAEGGIKQTRGMRQKFTNKLVIGTDPPLDVYALTVSDSTLNTKTDIAVMRMDAVWYIPSIGSPNGFSGNVETKLYDFVDGAPPTFSSQSVHCVLQGFGTFAGQTLMLSYEGPPTGAWTGYCLKG
jgi:hypothetical protein